MVNKKNLSFTIGLVEIGDPFGAATKLWPWEDGTNSLDMAKRRSKKNLNYPCFTSSSDFWRFETKLVSYKLMMQ